MREFKNEVNWSAICYCQELSEEFMGEMKDYVDWFWIGKYQNYGYDFAIKYQTYLTEGVTKFKKMLNERTICEKK